MIVVSFKDNKTWRQFMLLPDTDRRRFLNGVRRGSVILLAPGIEIYKVGWDLGNWFYRMKYILSGDRRTDRLISKAVRDYERDVARRIRDGSSEEDNGH